MLFQPTFNFNFFNCCGGGWSKIIFVWRNQIKLMLNKLVRWWTSLNWNQLSYELFSLLKVLLGLVHFQYIAYRSVA
jgi:hypothetical protein